MKSTRINYLQYKQTPKFHKEQPIIDEATDVQEHININTFNAHKLQRGEVKEADKSHQKSQSTEPVGPVEPSKDEDAGTSC